MNLKEKIQQKAQRVKIHMTKPKVLGLNTLEKTVQFLTPLATVGTLGANSNYGPGMKILMGPIEGATALYNAVGGYVMNVGVRDYLNGASMKLIDVASNLGENIIDHPVETLLTGLATYVIGKVTASMINSKKESMIKAYLNK